MAAGTIDSLQIEIQASSTKAAESIDRLAEAMNRLKTAFSGGTSRYTKMVIALREVGDEASKLQNSIVALNKVANMFERIANLKSVHIPKSLGDNIRNIGLASEYITPEAIRNLDSMTRSLQRLSNVDLKGVSSAMRAVRNNINPENAEGSGTSKDGSAEGSVDIREKEAEVKSFSKSLSLLNKNIDKTNGLLGNFVSTLKRIAFYRLIRTIIKEITQAFQEGLEKAYLYSSQISTPSHRFSEAMDRIKASANQMKGQLGSAFIALYAAVEPVLIKLAELVTKVADAISQFLSAFTGTTYIRADNTMASWADTMSNGARAAKEWKNQLLGFDEINRLEDQSNNGGGSGNSPLAGFHFEDANINSGILALVDKIKEHIVELELFGEAALIGLGLVLLFTGANVPLGLGLIALGAVKMAHTLSENWGYITGNVENTMAAIEMAVSGAFLGMGIMLLLSGANVPLGLGLIAVGALTMASAIAQNWDIMPTKIKKIIGQIDLIVSGALLSVGALLTFTGANPVLGIAMMIAGIGMALAGGSLMWDSVPNKLHYVLTLITTILGGALLALGAVIFFATPAFSPLGLGLMIAGAVSLAGAAALNWDWMKNAVKDVIGGIMAIVAGALVVLGVILCLSGAGIPLGLGLIYAGMKTSYAAFNVSDNALTRAVKSIADSIWNTAKSLIEGIIGGIKNVIDWIKGAFEWLAGLNKSLAKTNQMQNSSQYGFGMFASGGFPSNGQMFIAREAGPELVGSIGGRTAVANNDQIIEGIRQAAYEGFSAALAQNSNGGDTVVRVYLDSREIKSGQNRLNRAMGVS